MSHIAVWTNEDDSVRRKHYRPEEVDTSDCDYEVQEDGTHPSTDKWEQSVEYYNDVDGFHYEIRDATDGLTESETTEMKEALDNDDTERARELIRQGFTEVNN